MVQNSKLGSVGEDNDEDIPPELSFNYMEIPAREAVSAGVIRQKWLNSQHEKLGKFFDKYYNCQFIIEGGKVLASHILEDIRILGKQYTYPQVFNPQLKQYPVALGVDIGFGSSNTAIVSIVGVDDKLVVIYSKEFRDSEYNEVISIVAELQRSYSSTYKTPIYIDGSNPEFIRTLRLTLGLNLDPYPRHRNCVRVEDIREFGSNSY
jgi:hypothetical protein